METKKSEFMDRYLTPLAVLVAAVIIALALIYGHAVGTGTGGSVGTAAAPAVAVNIKDVKTDGEPFVGNANAPTTVALFFDYQCPFCKQFEQGVTPKLIENYVTSGKTKIVFKDFQFLGNDSTTAALFARAVWATYPNQFYPWFVAMFNAQDQEGDTGFGNLASIETLTKTIPGIDVAKVEANMNANQAAYQKVVDADRAEGAALGINGTPSIIVGTQLFTGLSTDQYYTGISGVLDSELKK